MPITRLTSTSNTATGAGSLAVNKPTGTQQDDLLLAFIIASGNTAFSSPLGWTDLYNEGNGTNFRVVVARRTAQSGDGASFTWSGGSNRSWVGTILGRRGQDVGNPIDASSTNGTTGSASSLTATSVTTSKANGELLALFATNYGSGQTYDPPSGMTEDLDITVGTTTSGFSFESAYLALGAIGATGDKTALASKSASYQAYQVAIRVGVVTTNQELIAQSTHAASFRRSVGKIVAAGSSHLSTFQRAVSRTFAATSSTAASIVRQTARTFLATSSQFASIIASRLYFKELIASSLNTATQARTRIYSRILAATSTASVSFQRQVGKLLNAANSTAALRVRLLNKLLSVASLNSVSIIRNSLFRKTLTATSATLSSCAFVTVRAVKVLLATLFRKPTPTSTMTNKQPQSRLTVQKPTSKMVR